jgi:hypothetical protein
VTINHLNLDEQELPDKPSCTFTLDSTEWKCRDGQDVSWELVRLHGEGGGVFPLRHLPRSVGRFRRADEEAGHPVHGSPCGGSRPVPHGACHGGPYGAVQACAVWAADNRLEVEGSLIRSGHTPQSLLALWRGPARLMVSVIYSFLADAADRNDERMWDAGKESDMRVELDGQFVLSAGLDVDEEVDDSNVVSLANWAAMANTGLK